MSLRLYAIYDHPTDHPNHWVVRRWEYHHGHDQPDAEPILCSSIEEARQHIQKLCPDAQLFNSNHPDPHLAEVWG